jgi:translation elongation factor EF-G
MKTIEIKAYEFNELNKKAKDKVLCDFIDINTDYDWWDIVYDEFDYLGLKVNSFDIYRQTIDIEFKNDIKEFCNNVVNDWNDTDMVNICDDYLENENNLNKLNESYYKRLIADEVLTTLANEYYYQTSNEAIIDTVEANEYLFTENGKSLNYII